MSKSDIPHEREQTDEFKPASLPSTAHGETTDPHIAPSIQKRQTIPSTLSKFTDFVGGLMVAVGALIFAGFLLSMGALKSSPLTIIITVMLIGFGLLGLVLSVKTWRTSSQKRDELLRSLRKKAQTIVIDRYEKQYKDEYGEIHTIRYVIIQFDAVQLDTTAIPVRLSVVVSKKLYNRLSPGETVMVEYASIDPRYAYLEGESRPS